MDDHMQAPGFDDAGAHKVIAEYASPNRPLGPLYGAGDGPVVEYQPSTKPSPSETSRHTKRVNDYGMRDHYSRENTAGSTSIELRAMADGEYPQPANLEDARPSSVDDVDLRDDQGNQSIHEIVLNAFIPQEDDDKPYRDWLPLDKLGDIFQPSRVRQELAMHFPKASASLVETYVEYVCGGSSGSQNDLKSQNTLARRTLAILILLQGTVVRDYLPDFVEHNVKDEHLPLRWDKSKDPHGLMDCKGKPLPWLGTLATRASFIKRFYTTQWQMLAPFISRESDMSVHEYHVDKNAIFPWTAFQKVQRRSEFGKVARVDIHPSHHTFLERHFALKTLYETRTAEGDQEFQAELRVFTKMKPQANLLTELYATFVVESHGGTQYSFLFPWAEGGSMDQMLERSPTRLIEDTATNPRLLLQWLAEQCHGLADGLRSIHDTRAEAIERAMEPSPALSPEVTRNLKELSKEVPKGQDKIDQDDFGIHGDLKPENILHFTQSPGPTGLGTLKIADFGLTKFFTRSRRSPLVNVPGIHLPALLIYSAPELLLKNEKYSRKADIWALGCIFSELISWVILGREGVDDYGRARFRELNVDTSSSGHFKGHCWESNSFVRAEFGPEIDSEPRTFLKDAVREQHRMLKAKLRRPGQSGSDILTDLLDFIEEKMLDTRRVNRISCDDLVKELKRFLKWQQESSPGDPYWDPPLPSFTSARRHNLEGEAMAVPSIFVDGPDQM